MFSTLLIGHTKYPGEQRVSFWPFKTKQLQKSNRQDMVFVQPPGIRKGDFRLSMDSVWFCKVLFHFTSNLQVIWAVSSMIAHSSQSWRNTPDQGAQAAQGNISHIYAY